MTSSDNSDWLPRLAPDSGPIYRAIADAIGAAVADGTLPPGRRLPTHRALAEALGVDLTTVTRAYAEARRRGLLDATVGRGTFVRGGGARAISRLGEGQAPVDLGMNLPPILDDPPLPLLLQQGFARLLTEGHVAGRLTYRTGAGSAAEKAAGATWLEPTLGAVAPERVLVTPGAQPALTTVLGSLAARGETVLTDPLTYPGLRGLAAQLGLHLLAVPGDADGMLPEALDAACRDQAPKALYLVPTMHNPTAITMPPARRAAIAEVALRHALPIVEDDAYGLLPAQPLPAIATLAPSLTFHVATLSKVISPALRLAFLVAPDASWATRLTAALRAQVLMASPLLTGLIVDWIADGTAHAVLGAIQRESAARQRIAREILPAEAINAHPEGLHLWLRLPAPWDRLHFAAHLRRQGLAVVTSDAFTVDPAAAPVAGVRLSLGAAPGRASLRGALKAVAEALATEAGAGFTEIV
ncbi:PLP-dependent aminotransferase family protein [Roseomonas sp. HJA6]|uniref:PLP-dependent aminotransferase family protein n=1 Tax=Roseomonas alba TaxID=2846776 RepID=A0ABS7AFE9_9PROT|nr:PLP-dependent aminotransferase family protein [Neoroseomonas alba]MBW6401026.1 PLP-dependent aminotransferase family protein [Neoroseomonas alba]